MEADARVRVVREACERFNAADLPGAAELLHPMVEWPDLMDDKLIWGREAVRDYWERQLVIVTPELTPVDFVPVGDDLVVVSKQRILDPTTRLDLLAPTEIVQRFSFRDGLIAKMTAFASLAEAVAGEAPPP